MGATNSTRRITVVNDETSGVIKISDSVVHRLRGEWESPSSSKGSSSNQKSSGGSGDAHQNSGQQAVNPRKEPPAAPQASKSSPEVMKVSRRERDDEVKRVDSYWRDKLRETERRNEEIHLQTVHEFNRGLMEVESLFVRPSCDAVCHDHQAKVKKCYGDNLTTSLNCSKEVKAFTDCVDALRQKTVASKG